MRRPRSAGYAPTAWAPLEQQGDLGRAAELMQVYVDYKRAIYHPDIAQDMVQHCAR